MDESARVVLLQREGRVRRARTRNWGAEMGPPHGLQRHGWRRDTLKIGEEVTVAGWLAKNGTNRMNSSKVMLTSHGRTAGRDARRRVEPGGTTRSHVPSSSQHVRGTSQRIGFNAGQCEKLQALIVSTALLFGAAPLMYGVTVEAEPDARPAGSAPAAGPAPQGQGGRRRRAQGRGAAAGARVAGAPGRGRRRHAQGGGRGPRQTGRPAWDGAAQRRRPCASWRRHSEGEGRLDTGLLHPVPILRSRRSVPAVGTRAIRRPSGTSSSPTRAASLRRPRQFLTPYGVEFVELPELQRLYIFDIGGPHPTAPCTWTAARTRSPAADILRPLDRLVGRRHAGVDTVGFNEDFWLDRRGLPHTAQLNTTERFTRTESTTIATSSRWTIPAPTPRHGRGIQPALGAGHELFEYVCQQANYANELMVGQHEKVDRSSFIVP